jgi:hypothetical protein
VKGINSNIILREEKINQSKIKFFKVCHQHRRGQFGKMAELLSSLLFNPPHIICLTEHHLKEYEINNILIEN